MSPARSLQSPRRRPSGAYHREPGVVQRSPPVHDWKHRLAAEIDRALLAADVTNRDLASLFGVSDVLVGEMRHGHKSWPLERLARVDEAFGTRLLKLVDEVVQGTRGE